MKVARCLFDQMVSVQNLMLAWNHFKRGKRKRKDVQYFERYVEDWVFDWHEDLVKLRYQHGPYEHFYVFDPQKRYISKACVRDRLVHQMLYASLSDVFDTAMRKKIYTSLENLQEDLDEWLRYYNYERPHSGKYCYGKTPRQTFGDSKPLDLEKNNELLFLKETTDKENS